MTRYTDSILHYFFLVFPDALHLPCQLVLVVLEDALRIGAFFTSVLVVQDGVEDLLAALLTVVNAKTNLDVLLRLQLSISQLLEEFKDDVDVFVRVLLE